MPSAPKIQKADIIETAFNILINEGYGEVNIKNVAKRLNCSTQPISWQFGNMDNFRNALLEYCIAYVKKGFVIKPDKIDNIIDGIAERYIDLALDTPNLYKYLYMGGYAGEKMRSIAEGMRYEQSNEIIDMLKVEYPISNQAAWEYLENFEFYVHGLASYVSTGFASISKQEAMKKIRSINTALITDCTSSN